MAVYVSRSAAWAPGIESIADWQLWAANPQLVQSDEPPQAAAVPAMTRRRLTRWGRQALEVAEPLAADIDDNVPIIFSSRHGDTRRTLKLLQTLATDEPLSPNSFSLSVHNSALGLFTILKKLKAPSLALAAGQDTLAAAWLEAESWLADGAERVLLVHTDEPLGEFYADYADVHEMPAALALMLTSRPEPGAVAVSLAIQGLDDSAAEPKTTESALMIRFLAWWYGQEPSLKVMTDQHVWHWTRDVQLG
ncbi:beta-ketoacyl synthase chain length factor [Gilvimarinus polysaccharolyticus]|uniref:beta-ketoacyl synthase chain length factor n=1 Tax=Gilvimarinus polysaccharolyticus TaxID=863921 RepID=UPI0006739FC8|nr:beta-ketoacyl synthase chain length factor [Gilvimarinus polysaccharolyticus]